MDKGFSFASVILGYFLVGGGMFTATLVGHELRITGEIAGLGQRGPQASDLTATPSI